jgi:hypothetical protein
MKHRLILNKGLNEQVQEFDAIENAFDAAIPYIRDGYIARMTDKNGFVKYTQSLSNGQIATQFGDATATQVFSDESDIHDDIDDIPARPWWKFW